MQAVFDISTSYFTAFPEGGKFRDRPHWQEKVAAGAAARPRDDLKESDYAEIDL